MVTKTKIVPEPYNAPACKVIGIKTETVLCVSNPEFGGTIGGLGPDINGGTF